MILYHGTNEDIETIDLTKGLRHMLQDRYLDQQYYFGTERALSFLHKTNNETV